MKDIKISVVVPIYNVSIYLDKCISSICNQSYTNLEIILVDDGSTDTSPQICDRYAALDSRISVIHKQNGGLVSARKSGVNAATGEYLIFVDGDDWIEYNHVEKIISSLHEKNPDLGIALSLKREYRDGSIADVAPSSDCKIQERIYYKAEFDESIWPEFISDRDIETFNIPVNACIKIYRSDFIRKSIQEVDDEVTILEDGLLSFICLLNANYIGITLDSGYHYAIHDGSMVHKNDSIHNLNAIKIALQCAYRYIDRLDIQLTSRKYYKKKWLRLGYYALMVSAPEYFCGLSEDFLFPYPNIKNGKRILVYGLGGYGYGLTRYILSSGMFILEGVSDRQIKSSGNIDINGVKVNKYRPKDLINIDFDYIVITTSRRNITDIIEEDLITIGVNSEKIAHMDQNLFNKDPFSPKWGGV